MNRLVLLPPYLEDTQAWKDLVAAIDETFKDNVDFPVKWLSRLRETWILGEGAESLLLDGPTLLSESQFETPERNILIRQANMIGFDFKEADLLTDEDYQRITRNLSLFWYGKGKPNFVNFLGFVLNTVMTIKQLWAQVGDNPNEYGTLYAEDDDAVTNGDPVWDNGDWYPTTHVRLAVDPFKFASVSVSKIVALFYSIANYNLVLDAVEFDGVVFFHSVDSDELSIVAAAYPLMQVDVTIPSVTSL